MISATPSVAQTAQSDQVVPLFLHIPKTAGTTFNNCIYEQYANGPKLLAEERGGRGWLCEGVLYYPTGFLKCKKPVTPRWVRNTLARDDLKAVTDSNKNSQKNFSTRQSRQRAPTSLRNFKGSKPVMNNTLRNQSPVPW